MLVPDTDVDQHRQDFAHVPDDREMRRGDLRPAQEGKVRHADTQGAGDGKSTRRLPTPLNLAESLRLCGQRHGAGNEAGPEIRVKHAAPVAIDLHRVHGMLDVQLIEAEDDIPHADPNVALEHEMGIRGHVCARGEEEHHQAYGRARPWQLPTEAQPVADGYRERGGCPEDDKRLHVGVLQRFNVCKDGREKRKRHGKESFKLFPIEFVHHDEAAAPTCLHSEPREEELHQQHKGWRRQKMHADLIDHEHQRGAGTISDDGEGCHRHFLGRHGPARQGAKQLWNSSVPRALLVSDGRSVARLRVYTLRDLKTPPLFRESSPPKLSRWPRFALARRRSVG